MKNNKTVIFASFFAKSIIFIILLSSVNNCYSQSDDENDPDFCNEKSVEHFNNGNYEKAIYYGERAKQIAEKEYGDEDCFFMTMWSNLNLMYVNAGNYKVANVSCNQYYCHTLKLYKKNKEGYLGFYVDAMNVLSHYNNAVCNYHANDTLLLKIKELYPKDTWEYAILLNNIAEHYIHSTKYSKAEPLFLESLKLYKEKMGKDGYYATISNNLGLLYYELGMYNKAEYYFQNSLIILSNLQLKPHEKKIYLLVNNNISYVYMKQKNIEAARSIVFNNLMVADINSREYLLALYTSGSFFLSNRQYVWAKFSFNQCISLCELKYPTDEIYPASLNALAYIYQKKKKFKKAGKYYKQNLLYIEKNYGENYHFYSQALSNLAIIYYDLTDYKNANSYFTQAADKTNAQITSDFSILTENEKFKYIKQKESFLETYFNFVFDYHKKQPELSGELFNNLLYHKKLILFNTRSLQELVENSKDTVLQNDYYKLYDTKQEIALLYTKNNITDNSKLENLQNKAEQLETKLIHRKNILFPNKQLNTNSLNYKAIQNTLADDEAVVEFTHFQRYTDGSWTDTTYYCALILRKDYKEPKLVFLCTEAVLQNKMKRKNEYEADIAYVKNLYSSSQKNGKGDFLYSLVWQNIDSLLLGVKKVYISQSGLLHNISFNALPVSNENCLLKDKYEINYISSSKNLLHKKPFYCKEIKTAAFFVDAKYLIDNSYVNKEIDANKKLGISSYAGRKINLDALPETKIITDSINRYFKAKETDIYIYTNEEANELNIKKMSNQAIDLLHVSTHGYYFAQEKMNKTNLFDISGNLAIDNSPFRSGLFMAGAQQTLDGNDFLLNNNQDGILSSYEISLHQFHDIRLVVLSACQTGLGDVQGNEGIIGLSRAFKTAGVEYIIISLWEVPSYQTIELMDLFYKYFSEGDEIKVAFSKAQHTMALKYKNPYFWAGFVLLN